MAEFFKGKNKTQVEQEQIVEGECDGGKRQGKDRDDENKPTNGELTKEAYKNDVKESEDAQCEKEEQEKAEENKEPPKPKLRGVKRVNEAFKERPELLSRLKNIMHFAKGNVIGEADMQVRRESVIDYLSQYRLVEDGKIEVYARTFALEDEDDDGIINFGQMKLGLEGVPGLMGMSRKQLNFVLQVLELSSSSRFTFKLYAVVAGLCERVALLSPLIKDYVEGMDLQAIERRMDIYKDMFYVNGDYSRTSITEDDLRIELKAGGLSQQQEDLVVDTIGPNQFKEISFLQYMAYLPLFLSIHENICKNALDMSRDKYLKKKSHVNET